jgi:hypothetical protein
MVEFQCSCRNIAIALTEAEKVEAKAQACENAWLRQLSSGAGIGHAKQGIEINDHYWRSCWRDFHRACSKDSGGHFLCTAATKTL